jgi:hypothetical protein
LIEEYLEADEPAECRIRIGHRSEFLPSAAEPETEVVSMDEQLKLPLDGRRRIEPDEAPAPAPTPVVRLHRPAPPVMPEPHEPARADNEADLEPAVERQKRAPYEWFVDRRPARAKTFQRGHFLYGCALGTAAAAVILAMLRVAFM